MHIFELVGNRSHFCLGGRDGICVIFVVSSDENDVLEAVRAVLDELNVFGGRWISDVAEQGEDGRFDDEAWHFVDHVGEFQVQVGGDLNGVVYDCFGVV